MNLKQNQKDFLINNKAMLAEIFQMRADDLFAEISMMEAGKQRDLKLDWFKEYNSWLATMRGMNSGGKKDKETFI